MATSFVRCAYIRNFKEPWVLETLFLEQKLCEHLYLASHWLIDCQSIPQTQAPLILTVKNDKLIYAL